ncbi:hypothetical protein D3C72_2012440 [compost metagenome]
MCPTRGQVAGKLDDHQLVVLFAHLGLQVGVPAALGTVQEILFVGLQRGGQGRARRVVGHLQQALFDQPIELRFVGKYQGVDIHQRAGIARAVGLDTLPGDALHR